MIQLIKDDVTIELFKADNGKKNYQTPRTKFDFIVKK